MVDSTRPAAPKVFVSYSWDDEDHLQWVHDFAARLRADGIDAVIDQWQVVLGDQLPHFMELAVRENDFILIACTPRYKERSDGRVGGVGYEGDIMTAEVLSTRNHRKVIPVLRRGDWGNAMPTWLSGKFGVDLRGNPYSEAEYARLVDNLRGQRPQAPPLGPLASRARDASPETASHRGRELRTPHDDGPIQITGVLADQVTSPRNDGTRDSALYAVPFHCRGFPHASGRSSSCRTGIIRRGSQRCTGPGSHG
jgi:TIR domain